MAHRPLPDRSNHPSDDRAHDRHHVEVIAYETDFGVERGVLGQVSRGVVRLGSKDGPGFVNAREDADQDLLCTAAGFARDTRAFRK
jgi:hypothetical protein